MNRGAGRVKRSEGRRICSEGALDINSVLMAAERGDPPPATAGLFGVDFPKEKAQVCLLGVPWDATSSYGSGSHRAPEGVRIASHQMDLEDAFFGSAYRYGIHLETLSDILTSNQEARRLVDQVIAAFDRGENPCQSDIHDVNHMSIDVFKQVREKAKTLINDGKIVGILGGDHSVSHPLLEALSEKEPFGVLHIDAHHDLRACYEGFHHSHASVFYNAVENGWVDRLVSVGIRDFSKGEAGLAAAREEIITFYDEDLFARKSCGQSWQSICEDVIAALPERVYISFDIDGLSPVYCPSTGTPVPGGLAYSEVVFLIHTLVSAGHQVVGFDLVEVVPNTGSEWDANVAARLLYKLCGAAAQSQQIKMY